MRTVCKFNSREIFFFVELTMQGYFLLFFFFECVYVSEIAWHLLSVPYIQNNLHKRTIVILIGLDRCRGGGGERAARRGESGLGLLWFEVQRVGGGHKEEGAGQGWALGVEVGGDWGNLSGTPTLWLSDRHCPSPRREQSCGNLQERETSAQTHSTSSHITEWASAPAQVTELQIQTASSFVICYLFLKSASHQER